MELASTDDRRTTARTALVGGLVFLVSLAIVWVGWNWETWHTAVVLVGTLGLVLYGIHRYELVALGRIETASDSTPATTDSATSERTDTPREQADGQGSR